MQQDRPPKQVARNALGRVTSWQERLHEGDFTCHKVRTDDNVADLMTKNLAADKMSKFITRLGYEFQQGDDDLTLKAA